jgi:integrase
MACKVKVNRHGFLAFRLYWDGKESWEGTEWKDTPKNRTRAEARAVLISEQIDNGTFDYLKWFPEGNRAKLFKPKVNQQKENRPITIREFYDAWIEKKKPPFVRKSLERDYRQAFNRNILPFMGETQLDRVDFETLENLRLHLVEERKLSLKTARNIIDGALRPMLRDAARKVTRNPFNDIPRNWWPRLRKKEPDPFTENERDRILNFYKNKRPYWAYAFVYFRFYTGTRPSEAAALKWGNIDLTNGKATIAWSRTLGEENAPKTEASARTFSLLPNVVDLLKAILPLHVSAEDYVFTDDKGKPIDQNEFGRKFGNVLRVLEMRPRRFYNTRHTYISVALTLGCNQKWIAEQTGTSIAMIQQNYGKYIRDDGDALLRAYVADTLSKSQTNQEDECEDETETFTETFSGETVMYTRNMVVPTGIEPVLPT